MKITKAVVAGVALSMLLSSTAMAGTWKKGDGENQNRWWYDNENGTYAHSGWQWLDGNKDGAAECYYFDSEGWLLTGTTTPDGYQVNADGAWTVNGAVQTKNTAAVNASVGGEYNYYMTAIYVKNEQTNSYDLYKETKRFENEVTGEVYNNEVWDERYSIGEAADLADLNIYVQTDGENRLIQYGENDIMDGFRWYLELRDGEWVCTSYKSSNGNVYEANSDGSDTVKCDGVTFEFIDRRTVSDVFLPESPYYPLIGKEVMVKEIYKKK